MFVGNGWTTCLPCLAGHYQDNPGESACKSCAPGEPPFASICLVTRLVVSNPRFFCPGLLRPLMFHSPAKGNGSDCDDWFAGTATDRTARDSPCPKCAALHVAPRDNSSACFACGENSVTEDNILCQCYEGFFDDMDLKVTPDRSA